MPEPGGVIQSMANLHRPPQSRPGSVQPLLLPTVSGNNKSIRTQRFSVLSGSLPLCCRGSAFPPFISVMVISSFTTDGCFIERDVMRLMEVILGLFGLDQSAINVHVDKWRST
ncbi:hypothetical protein RRG08_033720 [Elysia crispata]|uniref:Uncharacterized protein n=1 Tax=Elysia crispata TaxID=231223 RepID=A0AAE1DVV7_9GAST|nr:hypothetical protein RRG08_033720 [Elysia crispata]